MGGVTGSDATSELESILAEVAVALFAPGTLEATLQHIVTLAVATVDGCDAAGVFLAEDGQSPLPPPPTPSLSSSTGSRSTAARGRASTR